MVYFIQQGKISFVFRNHPETIDVTKYVCKIKKLHADFTGHQRINQGHIKCPNLSFKTLNRSEDGHKCQSLRLDSELSVIKPKA